MFLISNYCFSELSSLNQDSYRQILFPKIANGFIVWNAVPLFDFGFPAQVEPEVPNTGDWNKYRLI